MTKKYLFHILLCLVLTIFVLVGCQTSEKKSESESNSSENNSPPSSLEDLESLSEDILSYIDKKDWSMSVKQIKSMHSTWNDFFVEAQKKGMTSEKAEDFNKDLNTLTNLIIKKSMEDNKKKLDLKYKKAALELEKSMSNEENSNEEGNNGGRSNEEKPGEFNETSGKTSSSDSSSQSNSSNSTKDSKEEIILPEEVLPDSYPLMTSTPEELEIAHAAVKLTSHIPYMTDLFESELPSDILTLRYLLRDIRISSKQSKWNEVQEDLTKINETWSVFQPKVIEKKDTLAIKFNQSIVELEDVIKQKDSTLTTIKCDVALENIKKITELFDK